MNSKIVFSSERLNFRPFENQDFDFLFGLYQNPQVMNLIGGVRNRAQTESLIQKFQKHYQDYRFGMFVLERKIDLVKIGYCGCRFYSTEIPAEMGYIIDEPYWTEKFATEAAIAVTREMKKFSHIAELTALINPENIPSQRVIQKCGFIHVPSSDGIYHGFFRKFFSKKNS